jgi:hypothetical protein
MVIKRMWLTWKDKLKAFEELDKGGSLKACAGNHHVAPKNMGDGAHKEKLFYKLPK